jgi:ATP-binding cassette subfamily C (CFTR/MRP) protein 1
LLADRALAQSTLMLALLRIVEARRGKILIDGVDIAGIGLTALRDRVGIVPQNPGRLTPAPAAA